MKKVISFLLIFFSLHCFFSCKKINVDKSVSALLERAESLMNISPDSSLVILQRIETPEKLPKSQYALWCLLITQANDKNYIAHKSDSLIMIAVTYFEKEDDKHNLMKAYYYTAVFWDDFGDAPRAQNYYLKALSMANDLNNNAFLGRIYFNLGSIYLYQDMLTISLDFEKKALELFSLLDDTANIVLSNQIIGRIYKKENQPDSSLHYYHKTLEYQPKYNSASIYNEIGSLYTQKGEFVKALSYFDLSLSNLISDDKKMFTFYNLGDLYRITGDRDSAIYYLSQCTQSSNIYTKSGAYLGLAYIEEKERNWESYASYLREHHLLKDSIDMITHNENLHRIQGMFNYQQAEKERYYHEQEANKKEIYYYRVLIISFFIVVFLMLIIYYYRHTKILDRVRSEKEIEIQIKKREQVEGALKQKEKIIEEKEMKAMELEDTLLAIKKKYFLQKDATEDFFSSDLFIKIKTEKVKIKNEDWKNFEECINKMYPDISERIKTRIPTIDLSELRLCYLKKLNCLTVNRISSILNIQPNLHRKVSRR